MQKATWEKFIHTNSNVQEGFEELCRIFFRVHILKNKYANLIQSFNNAGIEFEPVLLNDKRISMQAKFFGTKIDYEDILDSAKKIVDKYSGRIDKVYLFCNKDLTIDCKSYKTIQEELGKANIEIEPFCNNNILDEINVNKEYSDLKEIYFGEKNYSDILKTIQENYKNYIDRKLIKNVSYEREEIKELIENINNKFIIIHGDSGCGKSVISRQLCDYFDDGKIQYLPISIDINLPLVNLKEYGKSFGLNLSPVASLASVSKQNKGYLILDQIDAIRWNSLHSTESLNLCSLMIKEALQYENVTIVFVTRSIDVKEIENMIDFAGTSENINKFKIKIDKLHENKIKEIVTSEIYNKAPKSIKNLLKNIGNIKMFLDIQNLSGISSSMELISQYKKEKYLELEKSNCFNNAKNLEQFIVNYMQKHNKLYITKEEIVVKFEQSLLDKMIRVGILEETKDKKIKFFHQSIYDYNLASDFYSKYKENNNIKSIFKVFNRSNVEYLEIAKQLMEIIRKNDADVFCDIVEFILFNNKIRFILKKIAIDEFRVFNDRTKESINLFYKIIKSRNYGVKYAKVLSEDKSYIIESMIQNGYIEILLEKNMFADVIDVLYSVANECELCKEKFVEIVNEKRMDKEKMEYICTNVIDDMTPDEDIFNLKIEIMKEIPKVFHYMDIRKIKNNISRFYKIVKAYLECENEDVYFELKEDHIVSLCENYAEKACELTYNYFENNKEKYYWYLDSFYGNSIKLRSKLDLAKKIFSYGVKYLNEDEILNYINGNINFVCDFSLKSLLYIDEKKAISIFKKMISAEYICKQNFSSGNMMKIHILSELIGKFSGNLSKREFNTLEDQILRYKSPNLIKFAKNRFEQRKQHNMYYAYYGEEQKILLSSLKKERISDYSKELLKTLNRKFEKLEMYSKERDYGEVQCHTVVPGISKIIDKLSKKQWIKILTNEKTGKRESNWGETDAEGNYVEYNLNSFQRAVEEAAKKQKNIFVEILLGSVEIRKEFIPYILFGLTAEVTDNDKNIYSNELLAIFKRYFDINDEYKINSFLRFVEHYQIYDEWVINNLIQIAQKEEDDSSKEYEENNYYSIWQHQYNNISTYAIICLNNYLFDLEKEPEWFMDLFNMCMKRNKPFLLSAIQLAYSCIKRDVNKSITLSFEVLEKYPELLADQHFLSIMDKGILKDEFYSKYKKCVKKYFERLTAPSKEHFVDRIVNYYVFYNKFKNIVIKCIKKSRKKENSLAIICLRTKNCLEKTDKKDNFINDKYKRLILVIKKIIKYNRFETNNLLLHFEENINFLCENNLLPSIIERSEKEKYFFLSQLNSVFQHIPMLSKYQRNIFYVCKKYLKINSGYNHHISDMLSWCYRIYGEYSDHQKLNKKKCLDMIDRIYERNFFLKIDF